MAVTLVVTTAGLALATPVAAQPQPQTTSSATSAKNYQQRALVLYGDPSDPVLKQLRQHLAATRRFTWYEAIPGAKQPLESFLADLSSRTRGGSLYVVAPRFDVGAVRNSEVKTDKSVNRDGSFTATAYTTLDADYTLYLDVYDVATRRRIDTAEATQTVTRRFEYRYDHRTPPEVVQMKSHELVTTMVREATRPPLDLFATQIARAKDGLPASGASALSRLSSFRLDVQVRDWEAVGDRINFNLGRNFQVRHDDGFALMRGDRQIGYLKVRELGENASAAQPLYIETGVSPAVTTTDHVVEAFKGGWNHGVRVGAGWIDGPLYTAGYAGEVDMGPTFGASEHYMTWGLGGVTDFIGGGTAFDVGYAKKLYARRLALRLGVKAGGLWMNGKTGNTLLPGFGPATGVEYHFNEHVLFGLDLDLMAYWPFIPKDGPRMGQTVYPVGPLGRTGFTILF